MTILKRLTEQLQQKGMFPDDAQNIMSRAVEQSQNRKSALYPMKSRWDDDAEGYPPQLLAITWVAIKAIALEWIDEHYPQAWYRSMFE